MTKNSTIKSNFKKLTTLLTCSLTFSVIAETPLWKVSKDNQHLFIGGTIHILNKSDFPLPAEFEKVYKQSELVIFETDIAKSKTPEFQAKVMQQMSYQDGSTLADKLSPETLKALEDYLSSNGVPLVAVQNFKPGMIISIMTIVELKKLGIVTEGVDQFYYDKASSDNKGLEKLETIDQQIAFMSGMGEENPDDFIKYSLKDLKRFPTIFQQLKTAWKQGDMPKLAEIGINPMKEDYSDVYQDIIVKRNKAWIPQIESMMNTKEIEMVLVGALHLAGEDSVLKMLKDKGYTIEQY